MNALAPTCRSSAIVRSRSIGPLAALIALAIAAPHADAAEGTPSPRLKYRSKGPVCACSSDLDEQTIDRALSARIGKAAAAPSSGASSPHPPSRPPLQPQEQRR